MGVTWTPLSVVSAMLCAAMLLQSASAVRVQTKPRVKGEFENVCEENSIT